MSERNEVLENLARKFQERRDDVDTLAESIGEPEHGMLKAQGLAFKEAAATALRMRT